MQLLVLLGLMLRLGAVELREGEAGNAVEEDAVAAVAVASVDCRNRSLHTIPIALEVVSVQRVGEAEEQASAGTQWARISIVTYKYKTRQDGTRSRSKTTGGGQRSETTRLDTEALRRTGSLRHHEFAEEVVELVLRDGVVVPVARVVSRDWMDPIRTRNPPRSTLAAVTHRPDLIVGIRRPSPSVGTLRNLYDLWFPPVRHVERRLFVACSACLKGLDAPWHDRGPRSDDAPGVYLVSLLVAVDENNVAMGEPRLIVETVLDRLPKGLAIHEDLAIPLGQSGGHDERDNRWGRER